MKTEADKANQLNRERRAATCAHFNGVQCAVCGAGVALASFPIIQGQGRPLPCLPPFRSRPNDIRPTCPKFEPMGMERVLAEEKEWAVISIRVGKARAAIVDHAKGAKGVRGRIACPICEGGELSFSIAGCNGHIHARCSTPDCVAWME